MKFSLYTIFAIVAILSFSCTKTTYEIAQSPYTDILSFYVEESAGNGQKLEGVVSGDSIVIYWQPGVAIPTQIRPTIQLSKNATISPSSGVEVPFADNTVYTVTAEDGQQKTYLLKVKIGKERPILTAIVGNFDYLQVLLQSAWTVSAATAENSGVYLHLLGEHFLSGRNIDDIKVYAQRVHDGYEFDLPIRRETAQNTNLQVELPKFSTQMDTGRHRIWVQISGMTTDSRDVFFIAPQLTRAGQVSGEFAQAGTAVKKGQVVSLSYQYTDPVDGAITRYYDPKNLHAVAIGTRVTERIDTIVNPVTGRITYRSIYKDGTFLITDFQASTTKIEFTLPDDIEAFAGGNVSSLNLLYNNYDINGNWTYLTGGGATQYAQPVFFTTMLSKRDPLTNQLVGTTIVSAK